MVKLRNVPASITLSELRYVFKDHNLVDDPHVAIRSANLNDRYSGSPVRMNRNHRSKESPDRRLVDYIVEFSKASDARQFARENTELSMLGQKITVRIYKE